MRRYRVLIILGVLGWVDGGLTTAAPAADQPPPGAAQAREKFARLLLPAGPQKRALKAADKPRRVVVNAFGGPPGTPVNPRRPGNRP